VYEAFYHLTADPFQLSPDPRFYFDSLSHKKAMAYLTYGLSRGEGFIVISGDTGKGKTTLAQRSGSNLDPSTYISVNLVTTQLDPTEMLRLVASGFGLDCAQDGKATIIERLSAFLKSNLASGRRPLLIVDEAQNLTTQSLEELRAADHLSRTAALSRADRQSGAGSVQGKNRRLDRPGQLEPRRYARLHRAPAAHCRMEGLSQNLR
jgi:type II secretory pathway predicted ATPase ExeA